VPGVAVGGENGRELMSLGEDSPVFNQEVHLPRFQACQLGDPLFLGPCS
jgi:hypothetical protein